MSHSLQDYQFELPEELIAKFPPETRGESRMLVIDRSKDSFEILPFTDFPSFLKQGDVLVLNNTRVIPSRLYGRKESGGQVEALLTEKAGPDLWKGMMRPGRRLRSGQQITLLDNKGEATEFTMGIDGRTDDGLFLIRIADSDISNIFEQCGHMPLPPYMRREDEESDRERYQTVFSKNEGAVAAPTAGLHFTEDILAQCRERGVRTVQVTLHTGMGTFQPVSIEDITAHKMHSEWYELPADAAKAINEAKASGERVVAIGTTCVRTLESCASEDGQVQARCGDTTIFLYPPYQPRAVDCLLTNFHLPGSTLLMLVSCFADRDKMLKAYQHAIDNKMRFFSYGDCCLII